MAPSALEGWLEIFFLPKHELHFFIDLIYMNPLVVTGQISLPSNLIQGISGGVTEPEFNRLLDFILVICHWYWFYIVTLWQYLLVVLAIRFQESYVKGIVSMTEVKVAAEVEGIVVMLVVYLCNWEWTQPSPLHFLVDIW